MVTLNGCTGSWEKPLSASPPIPTSTRTQVTPGRIRRETMIHLLWKHPTDRDRLDGKTANIVFERQRECKEICAVVEVSHFFGARIFSALSAAWRTSASESLEAAWRAATAAGFLT